MTGTKTIHQGVIATKALETQEVTFDQACRLVEEGARKSISHAVEDIFLQEMQRLQEVESKTSLLAEAILGAQAKLFTIEKLASDERSHYDEVDLRVSGLIHDLQVLASNYPNKKQELLPQILQEMFSDFMDAAFLSNNVYH